jgi:tetratricopeptide (TPR) repeat protein
MPLLDSLGHHSHRITSDAPEAQRYFDQGLRLLYGFNHGGAIRSFESAVRADPECAMAHWGIALALGPHINFPFVPPPLAERAVQEVKAAQAAKHTSPAEQDYIAALARRYASPQPEDRSPLDRAYAGAMRGVWQQHPDDPDAGALFAEAMMDLRPWDQWTPEGQAQPGTDEIIATLEAVLKLDLQHPFANHLYIHAVEASPHPERGVAAADRLYHLQPGLAHNVHMPSHIYIRVGRWADAVECNTAAVEADRLFRLQFGPPKGFINVYIAHNQHMLAYAAMMTGQSEVALRHIRAAVDGLPADFLKENASVAEAFVAMPLEVMTRFGHWDEVLAQPDDYPDYMPFTRAFRHAARGIAFAAKGDTAAARREQADYLARAKAVPADEIAAGNNTCRAVLAIVTPMLEGEILLREGRMEAGIAALRDAVKAEDALHYDEPPGWLIPVRHSLGAALLRTGRFAEAEQVYRDDLRRLPNNGWALLGLSQALAHQQKTDEARTMRATFDAYWRRADLTIPSSCLCQPGV